MEPAQRVAHRLDEDLGRPVRADEKRHRAGRVDAVREYCRYLALSLSGGDAADVTERIAQLAPPAAVPEAAATQFRTGLQHFDRRRFRDAERAFSAAIAGAPDWDAAYYNRALAYAGDGQPERAVRDLEKYLELVPETRDRPAIVRQIAALRRRSLVPSTALTRGLLLPGGRAREDERRGAIGGRKLLQQAGLIERRVQVAG